MLKIQQMAETVAKNGVQIYNLENTDDVDEKSKRTVRKSTKASHLFWQALSKNTPFVFSPVNIAPVSLAEDDSMMDDFVEFEKPFEIFSIEVAGQNITVSRPEDKQKVSIACIMILPVQAAKERYFAFVLYFYEGEPYVFMEGCWNKLEHDQTGIEFMSFEEDEFLPKRRANIAPNNFIAQLAKKYTDRLNQSSVVGVENTAINVNHRDEKNKRTRTQIKNICHIVPKNMRPSYKSTTTKEIQWTHRFWRRGSWVNFYIDDNKKEIDYTRIGKNRAGEYTEYGRTWRLETIVNQDKEHLPLINKIRMVKNSQPD